MYVEALSWAGADSSLVSDQNVTSLEIMLLRFRGYQTFSDNKKRLMVSIFTGDFAIFLQKLYEFFYSSFPPRMKDAAMARWDKELWRSPLLPSYGDLIEFENSRFHNCIA